MFGINTVKVAIAVTFMAALAQVGSAQGINNRFRRQHCRIDSGLKDHQLNRYEAGALRAQDARIHAEERYDRLTDHGRLTAREHASLERQLNRNSRRIWDDRHNRG